MMYKICLLSLLLFSSCIFEQEISEKEVQKIFSKATISKVFVDSEHNVLHKIDVYQVQDFESKFNGLELVVIHLKNPQMRVKHVNSEGVREDIYPAFADSTTFAIVNGGYFGFNHKETLIPLGLSVDDSATRSNYTPWDIGGVIYDNKRSIEIAEISKFDKELKYRNALQSKPIVVLDGKQGIYSQSLKLRNRTAIGKNAAGDIVIVGVFNSGTGAMSLYDFSKILTYKINNKPLVDVALAMDGGKSSYLYIPKLHKFWGNKVPLYVPNVVVFNL